MPIEDELRTSLKRAARSAHPSLDAFPRLLERERQAPSGPSLGTRIGAALVAAFVAVGAAVFVVRAFDRGGSDAADTSPIALDGTSWVLETIDGKSAIGDRWATLHFEEGAYLARSECNETGGEYSLAAGMLRTTGGDRTDAACPDVAAEQRETAFFDVLQGSPTATVQGASLVLRGAGHEIGLAEDPCSLLRSEQVADATGSAVTSHALLPPSGMRIPGTGPLCRYEVPGPYASVVVAIRDGSIATFREERDPINSIDIAGLGEGAYVEAMAGIVVLDEGRLLMIHVQHGAGMRALPVLEDLARVATGDRAEAPPPDAVLTVRLSVDKDEPDGAPIVEVFHGGTVVRPAPIDTPGDELAYPSRGLETVVPFGTPIVVENETAYTVSISRLRAAGRGELVETAAEVVGDVDVLAMAGDLPLAIHYENSYATGTLGLVVHVADSMTQLIRVDPLARLQPGWTQVARPPEVRSSNAAKVWTGTEMLTWGGYVYTGYSDEVARGDGFAWEPVSGRTRILPPSPLEPRVSPAYAWTGRDLLIWGGGSDDGASLADGAAYSPEGNTWRKLSSGPLSPRIPAFHVWTGEELVVWGHELDRDVRDGAAYDPSTDAWRPIAEPPSGAWRHPVWTGREVIVFTNPLTEGVTGSPPSPVAAYDPRLDQWRKLPSTSSVQAAAWDGGSIVTWGWERSMRLDPADEVWTPTGEPPVAEAPNYDPDVVGGDGWVFGARETEAALFDGRTGRWERVTLGDTQRWGDSVQVVAAGNAVIYLRRNNATRESAAYVFRP